MSPNSPAPAAEARLLAALALLSATATAQQIVLMQVLGWMHWHHFAYMIVAIALLGFGIAGTILTLARDRLVRLGPRLLPWLLLGTAVTIPAGLRGAQVPFVAVDLPMIFFAPENLWRLLALCGLLLPPFFCAGLASAIILTMQARRAGRFYAASLAGGGVGGLAGLLIVANLSPPRAPIAVALLAAIAATTLWRELTAAARAAAVATLALIAVLAAAPGELRSSQFKPLSRVLEMPGARIVAAEPSVHGWIQIADTPALRPSPAVSLEFQGEIPRQPAVFVNGVGVGSLVSREAVRAPQWLDFTTDATPFAIAKPRRVALLENGPGGWAALAMHHGATRIEVVEPNATLVDLLTRGDPPLAPEWRQPGVEISTADGRTFLRRSSAPFDFIRFPTVGALGGSAGLAAASEQFLFTREAFTDAWQRLAPDGVMAATAWLDFPERNAPRLLATLAEALEREAAAPRTHIVAVRSWATVTVLARRSPWTATEIVRLREFCAARGFDPLLLPDLEAGERDAHHTWQNPAFFPLVDALVSGPREAVYRTYPFHLRPPTDTRPYFSQFARWTDTARLRAAFAARTIPFFELGSLVVALTFAALAALAVLCIVAPLFRLGWQAPGKRGVLLYFAGLGAGFMFVEIGLMLRAQAWLGSPVLAAAVVITSLLVAAGTGSAWSERLSASPKTQRRALAAIVGLILAAALLLSVTDAPARGWPLGVRAALLVAIVAATGVALGTAFPLGLRRLEAHHPAHVPWAWAINGCVSVATPAGAMLLAMHAGFGALFVGAAAAYGVALLGVARDPFHSTA